MRGVEQVHGVFCSVLADADGDIVSISSDEELVEALDQFEGNVFRLFIKKSRETERE